jgi:hypothetical protein
MPGCFERDGVETVAVIEHLCTNAREPANTS